MSSQVLARKWRPSNFNEVMGQSHVLQSLHHALANNRLHHAYLFSGTRGVGKTTLARLFAKGLNCEVGVTPEPCGTCQSCKDISVGRFIDLIEIDAASKTKVDDTRELLENVQYMPSQGRYKVYLIDEVHMLSRSSFNALLKTLEEPPAHVKFVLATTEPQKLPMTVLSRCFKFNLKSLTESQIDQQLSYILEQEGIHFDGEGLKLLSVAAQGSMRDALSLTEQAIAYGSGGIEKHQVHAMLGTVDRRTTLDLIYAVYHKENDTVLKHIEHALSMGLDADALIHGLLTTLHQLYLAQGIPSIANNLGLDEAFTEWLSKLSQSQIYAWYQSLLKARETLPFAPTPKSGVEMALLHLTVVDAVDDHQSQRASVHSVEAQAQTVYEAAEQLKAQEPCLDKEDVQADTMKPLASRTVANVAQDVCASSEVSEAITPDPIAVEQAQEPASIQTQEPDLTGTLTHKRVERAQISDPKAQDLLHSVLVLREKLQAQVEVEQQHSDVKKKAPQQPLNNSIDDKTTEAEAPPQGSLDTEAEPWTDVSPNLGETQYDEQRLTQQVSGPQSGPVHDEDMFWYRCCRQMALRGRAKQLALNSVLTRKGKDWYLALIPEQRHLLNAVMKEALEAALEAIDSAVKLHIEVKFMPERDIPITVKVKHNQWLKQRAEATLLEQPCIQALQEHFGAKIISETVEYPSSWIDQEE
jgi:DNA polymerase-3 subunit gamma/tau